MLNRFIHNGTSNSMYHSLSDSGFVYIVGAGPGASDLITVRGLRCLQRADVVVYDRLIAPELLDEAPSARHIYVGKAPSSHACSQEEINRILVHEAQQGHTVVRLKGGDPFVFGRGGEEGLALAAAGIPFAVVPGITSAVAVPALAGIPVTQRNMATSFTVVTGHTAPRGPNGENAETCTIDWGALPHTGTLVILMGLGNLSYITAQLLAHGRAADTPVAVIAQGATPRQSIVTGTLSDIAVTAQGLHSPATIVVGDVVNLSAHLTAQSHQPPQEIPWPLTTALPLPVDARF